MRSGSVRVRARRWPLAWLLVTVLAVMAVLVAPRTATAGAAGAAAGEAPVNLLNVHSGRCMEVENSSSADGAKIRQWDCEGQPGARWLIRPSAASTSAVNIVNAHSGKCLAVRTDAPAGGTVGTSAPRVEQWGCAGSPGVDFEIDSRTDSAWILSRTTTPMRCLEVENSAERRGAPIVLSTCANQKGIAFQQRPDRTGNDIRRDDLSTLYGYDNGSVSLFRFPTNSAGGFETPDVPWSSPAGSWDFTHSRMTSGDFNGDGRRDAALLRGHGDGSIALLTMLGTADGGYAAPFKSWERPPGNWWGDQVQLTAGDYDGDGRDEAMALYGYKDGSVTLFRFRTTPDGAFQVPSTPWSAPAGTWDFAQSRIATGDFDADGRQDVALFKGTAHGAAELLTLTGTADGGLTAPLTSWHRPPGNWWGNQVKLAAGDHDGDGRDELIAMYGYNDGAVSLFRFATTGDGGFQVPTVPWSAPPGTWTFSHSHVVSGDYNGDGRRDLALFKGTTDGAAALLTLLGAADGRLVGPLTSWQRPPGNWWGTRTLMI
ncbi:hypothetical protein DMA15_00725 [Streptomyces sp. WAC 01529]|uniref:RICIN domain-containing protein n=1 Tax=Streptomyces sp. WAC 01529 TaxID=2203205 RepID=UPI000F71F7F1|nr:RICIN domain-containing protein [Streptomyces sp. WAC 01529]AZM51288.1 hypothetical protein DMA15_00725 [Streptomyces sp. WAC 01529]